MSTQHPAPAVGRGAVYCWVPDRRDADQTGVAEQELLAREHASRLGVGIDARHVFADTRLTAWAPGRPRPGWEAMLVAARAGEFHHLFLYRCERLERHACALVELLDLAQTYALLLHGHPSDLNNPGQRAQVLERARRTCRRAEHASDRAKRARQEYAAAGRAHGGGLRRYGYTDGMGDLVEAEAEVVREIFARFIGTEERPGESLRALALDLNARKIPTAYGNPWTVGGVTRIIDAPRYAGLTVRGREILRSADGRALPATWPACVSVADWEAAQALRRRRAEERTATRRPHRDYPLTSLVRCTRCGRPMVGTMVGTYPTYACTSSSSLAPGHCSRHIGAEQLEAYVFEQTLLRLERLDAHTVLPTQVSGTGGLPTPGTSARDAHRAVVVRRIDALDGVTTGPKARFDWGGLPVRRRAETVQFLFSAILISESSTVRSVFDTGRIELVPHLA